MRVVIGGGGAVGRHLGRDLTAGGHDVTIIEQDPVVAEDLSVRLPGATVLIGDACEPWVLEQAALATADVVVAATGDDEDNLVTSLLAKQEFGVPRVVARVNDPQNEWLFTEQWGVDAGVSPPHILSSLVEEAVSVGDLIRLMRLEGGKTAIVEVKMPAGSPNLGRSLSDLRPPRETAIVAVIREGSVVIPQPHTVLAAGDEIVALAAPSEEAALREAIVGAGVAGTTPEDKNAGAH